MTSIVFLFVLWVLGNNEGQNHCDLKFLEKRMIYTDALHRLHVIQSKVNLILSRFENDVDLELKTMGSESRNPFSSEYWTRLIQNTRNIQTDMNLNSLAMEAKVYATALEEFEKKYIEFDDFWQKMQYCEQNYPEFPQLEKSMYLAKCTFLLI